MFATVELEIRIEESMEMLSRYMKSLIFKINVYDPFLWHSRSQESIHDTIEEKTLPCPAGSDDRDDLPRIERDILLSFFSLLDF